MTDGSNENNDTYTMPIYVYIICGIIIVAVIACSIVLCLYTKKGSKRESVDENPDYGEAYYEGNSQIMDQNDYYYTDV